MIKENEYINMTPKVTKFLCFGAVFATKKKKIFLGEHDPPKNFGGPVPQ